MKNVVFGLLSAMLVTGAVITPASAYTCNDRAQFCANNGNDRNACFEPTRMAQCAKTGTYVSPKGISWAVNGKAGQRQ